MARFGKASQERLMQAHPDLQRLLSEAIGHVDFSIVCSYRGREEQGKAVAQGKSKTPWPTSKHNHLPSLAVDLCPYRNGMKWNDREAFYYLGGILKGLSIAMGIPIRWGGDWDGDNDLHDQRFTDLPHFEIRTP